MSRVSRAALVAVASILPWTAAARGQPRLGPYVVDSNGVKVGHALDSTDALIFLDGVPIKIGLLRSGFAPFGPFTLYFADDSCAGPPLMEAGADVLFGMGYYTTDGVIHYFSGASVSEMPLLSQRTVVEDGTLGACNSVSFPLVVAPALTAAPPTVTPPLSVVESVPVSPAPATATFNDVPTTHPFFQFIEALAASGITAGCQASPPLYCPDASITRGQMAVFLAKALGL